MSPKGEIPLAPFAARRNGPKSGNLLVGDEPFTAGAFRRPAH